MIRTRDVKAAVDRMESWWYLAGQVNMVMGGQPLDKVGGSLALLTAMLMVGSSDDAETREEMLRQHYQLAREMIPLMQGMVDTWGGWDAGYEASKGTKQ